MHVGYCVFVSQALCLNSGKREHIEINSVGTRSGCFLDFLEISLRWSPNPLSHVPRCAFALMSHSYFRHGNLGLQFGVQWPMPLPFSRPLLPLLPHWTVVSVSSALNCTAILQFPIFLARYSTNSKDLGKSKDILAENLPAPG